MKVHSPILAASRAARFGNDNFARGTGTAASIIPRAFGVGLVLPAVNLVAFQRKDNTRLLASTQIHAFNNEDSSARIGQRVPVQTAQLLGFGNNQGTTTLVKILTIIKPLQLLITSKSA